MKQRQAPRHIHVRSLLAVASKWGLAAALALGAVATTAHAARADEVDDSVRKLIELDQRVHLMSLEF